MTDADDIRLNLIRLGDALSRALLTSGRRDDARSIRRTMEQVHDADDAALLEYGPRLYGVWRSAVGDLPCVGRA